jgi:AcrR family transcriptional regulator
MGRKRTIDRDAVLDAAEAVVTEKGAGSLSFDEVARRAGISKGGVLYCFPSKKELVAAMAERDLARFEADVASHRARLPADVADAGLRAHLAATRHEDEALAGKAASLMAALAESGPHSEPVRRHYRALIDGFDPATKEGRRARLVFIAAEGAFLLRGLGLVAFDDAAWQDLFDDMEAMLARAR